MIKILLLRHAQPAPLERKLASHWLDPELSPIGRRQAECSAQKVKALVNGASCRLWSSDLRRAAQTAEAIGRALGVPVELRVALREFHNGFGPGETEQDVRECQPLWTPPQRDLAARPQGETAQEFRNRLAACMEEVARCAEDVAVVVAHYGANSNIVKWWGGLESTFWFETSLASLTVLRVKPGGKRAVERLNDTAHLLADGLGEEPLSAT